jgi:hypothetical protein
MKRTLITMGSRLADPKTPNMKIDKIIDIVLLKLSMVVVRRVLDHKARLDGSKSS